MFATEVMISPGLRLALAAGELNSTCSIMTPPGSVCRVLMSLTITPSETEFEWPGLANLGEKFPAALTNLGLVKASLAYLGKKNKKKLM